MVKFIEKYTKNSAPSEMSLRRKYLPLLYDKCIKQLQLKAKNQLIWISIDESTDAEQRLIANFIFGIMVGNEEESKHCYLLNIAEVKAANASCMAAFVNDSLQLLWPEGIQYENVLVAVTDSAAYMLAAMGSLSMLFPKRLHLTCFAHGLHRVAEFVRTKYIGVNALISNAKAVFLKAPYRRNLFKAAFPELNLPPQPCPTRWGTWLNAAEYYCDHFIEVHSLVEQFADEDAESIRKTKELLSNSDIKNELAYIKSNFICISAAIKKLETQGLSLDESLRVMQGIREKLAALPDKQFLNKFNAVIKRNKNFENLVKIHDIIFKNLNISNEYLNKLSPLEISVFKYCPVTSADIERSFSSYKNVLADNRRAFIFNNLKMHMIVHLNNTLTE